MRGARAFSLCSFTNIREASKKYSNIEKKTKSMPLSFFFSEPPPQKDLGETRFFDTTRATTKNLLAVFLAQPCPRALVL
jgi:hypothetical protein